MKAGRFFGSLAFSAVLAFATAAMLAQAQPGQPTLRDISAQQIELRGKVIAGKGPFKDLSQGERDALVAKQNRVLELIQGVDNIEDLRPEARVEVFNNIEWVKAAVTKAEDERMVCEYVKVTGSHRLKSVCMTAKQQREHRENARSSLNRGQKCNVSRELCIGESGD